MYGYSEDIIIIKDKYGSTVIDVLVNDTKKDLNELFDRIRKVETRQAVAEERDKTLIDKMDNLTEFFKYHDEAEMKKYDTIETQVAKLTNMFYIVTGIGIVLSFIGIENIKIILGV